MSGQRTPGELCAHNRRRSLVSGVAPAVHPRVNHTTPSHPIVMDAHAEIEEVAINVVTTGLAVCGVALLATAPAAAEPAPAAEAVAACTRFATALDIASLSYQGFANGLALGDEHGDPTLNADNESGRTGLRHAVSTALAASRTPGVAPEISAPMRAWSFDATKLVLLMGLRVDVDRYNSAATELNAHTEAAQSACAAAGTHA
ncbi:hypothetical protein [Mycobacterium sp. MS1601]|uniref:hypothetical protein n=1 Tax=Mycobacterium sp. MS1601 TaxID=1936029 RepID=UPI001F178894|nr:hypothetical protein [Mycobacterium sp. MS1601]